MHQPPPLKYTLRRLVTKWNAYGTFWGGRAEILLSRDIEPPKSCAGPFLGVVQKY